MRMNTTIRNIVFLLYNNNFEIRNKQKRNKKKIKERNLVVVVVVSVRKKKMTREREKRKERASLEGDWKKYVLNMYFIFVG
jgi:hypothetical protein